MPRFSLRYQLLVLTALALGVWGLAVNLPFSFKAGDVISAEQMNQTLQALNEGKQERVVGECAEGSAIRVVRPDGTVVCETDDVGAGGVGYTAGLGLKLSGTEFSLDASKAQARVAGTCAAGSSIRVINADGTVTCHTDQVGTGGSAGVSALNGKTGAVSLQAGTNVTIDDSTAGQLRISSSGGATYQADGSSLALTGTTFAIRSGGVTATHLADGAVSGPKIAMPLLLQGNTSSVAARIANADAAGMGLRVDVGSQGNTFANAALMGQAAGTGATGVFGTSGSGIGVWGRSDFRGVVGTLGGMPCPGPYGVGGCSQTALGVFGWSEGTHGMLGRTSSAGSSGVRGEATGTTLAFGVSGESAGNHGVFGRTSSAGSSGVRGEATGTTLAFGVSGSSTSGVGVSGESVNNAGVFGRSTNNNAAFFTGGSGGTGSCAYNGGAGWNCTSDRAAKENFAAIDAGDILTRLSAMPVSTWTMKGDARAAPHLGPTAQDFYAAFGLGDSDLAINSADAQGVALAAIQGLYELVQAQQAQIVALEARLAGLE